MSPPSCTLIVNPTSGSFSPRRLEKALAYLNGNGITADAHLTTGSGDAEAMARQLCTGDRVPFIVAVGGDGTTHEVINGIGDSEAMLAALPFGTSNVLARELGIRDEDDALQRIVRGHTRPLTLGRLERGGASRYFFLMAGIGVDGAVVAGVDLKEKKRFHQGAYLLSAWRLLRQWDGSCCRVLIDGRELEVHTLIACNAARYGGSFMLAPGASLFSPGLVAVCFTSPKRSSYLRAAGELVLGRGPEAAGLLVLPAERIESFGSKAIQVDGDCGGHGPVVVTATTGRVRLVV